MKKTIFIITGLFILLQWGCRLEELEVTSNCMEQGFAHKYSYEFSGNPSFTARGITEVANNEYVVCGTIAGNIDDIFLLKIDKNGNEVFFRQDEQMSLESAEAIVSTSDGGCLVGGRRDTVALFVKYDKNGQRQGDAISTIPDQSACNSLTALGNDRFIFTSGRRVSGTGVIQIHVGIVEINNDTPSITHEYTSPAVGDPKRAYAAIPANGGFIVSGEIRKNMEGSDLYIFELNANLELIADSEVFAPLSPNKLDRGRSLVQSYQNNEYIISGWNGGSAFAFRYNDNSQNVTTLSESANAHQTDGFGIVRAHTEGQYVIAGDQWQGSQTTAFRQLFVTKIDESGNPVWEKTFGDDNLTERGFRIIRTTDCGYAIVGFETIDALGSGVKAYIVKLDENGNVQ